MSMGAGCLTQVGAATRSKHQKGATVLDLRFAANWLARPQSSTGQSARVLDVPGPDPAAPEEVEARVRAIARQVADAAAPAGAVL